MIRCRFHDSPWYGRKVASVVSRYYGSLCALPVINPIHGADNLKDLLVR